MRFRLLSALAPSTVALLAAACGGDQQPLDPSTSSGAVVSSGAGGGGADDAIGFELPVVQAFDAARAAKGFAAFQGEPLGGASIPRLALDNLWLAWGEGPSSGPVYWKRMRDRYGLIEAPFENGELPLGFRESQGKVGFDCLLCHADRVAGKTVFGTGNSRLDLQGLFDDLERMNELAPKYGFPSYPMPYSLEGRTAAAGANDAMGLGLWLAAKAANQEGLVHERAGFQQAPAWWSLRFRSRLYLDGSGAAGSHRTMMAMLLGSGASLAEIQAKDALFEDIYQWIVSLEPPSFDLRPLDTVLARRGRDVFEGACAGCHGVHSGPTASFPDHVEMSAGTDPVRAASFDAADAAFVNASWFGQKAPMAATGGYLAPPLRGVWATAPYFHNGSVPDLVGVLDSSQRPSRWSRTGTEAADYEPERGGWRTTSDAVGSIETIQGRKVYDTARAGLARDGHTYGDALSPDDRGAVIEYLLGL